MILFRRVKRLTSLESTDLQNLWRVEFRTGDNQPDLSLSVFEVEDETKIVARVNAEVFASVPLGPQNRSYDGVDLTGVLCSEIAKTAGDTAFVFTRESHRELQIQNLDDLQALIAVVVSQRDKRGRPVPHTEVRSYILQKLNENDPEWVAACQRSVKWEQWARQK